MRFLLLLVVFTSLYIGGLGIPGVIDYDEGVYAEVSREMFVDHQYLLPTLNGEGFFEKPPLLYWSQMLGYRFFGTTAFGARFINALAGIATVLLVFLAGRRPLGSETAFRAAMILGSSLFFVYLSRIAMTDMLLTFFFTLCLCFSWWAVEQSMQQKTSTPWFLAGCLCAGLAMLTKGAIGALFPFITAFLYLLSIGRLSLLFQRSWILPGAIILTVVGFSWYLLLGFVHPDGFLFMKDLFIKHHLERFSTPLEGHSGPLYFYLIVLLVGFMPWSVFIPLAVWRCGYRDSSSQRVRFLRLFLLFSIITFGFFSVAATKLPNYICPSLPGIALLTATLFDEKEKTGKWAWAITTYFAAILILGLGILLLVSPLIIAHLPQMLGKSALKAPVLAQSITLGHVPYTSGLIMITSAVFLISVHRTKIKMSLFAALSTAALVVTCTLFIMILPAYDQLINRPLARLAEEAALKTPENGRIVMLEVSSRPSVNFASYRRTIGCGIDNIDALRSYFKDPKIQVAITTEYYLSRLQQSGVKTDRLLSDHGYVLFRLSMEHQPLPPPQRPEESPETDIFIDP